MSAMVLRMPGGGRFDVDELTTALRALGLAHPAASSVEAAQPVLDAWDDDADGRLSITEFTKCACTRPHTTIPRPWP